jgi:alkyldihydroxyacetonephosphate synthase
MKRWNGWGEETVTYPVHPSLTVFLERMLGPGRPPHDVAFADVIATVPVSRLPAHPLISTEADVRVLHARGQSLPCWIDLRSGKSLTFPDGVVHPTDGSEVREIMRYARQVGAQVIPYGGGTSVVGHINPLSGDVPVLTVNMSRMNSLRSLEEATALATFGAGVTGPDLEAQLRAKGYTLGHFPQSFELSTLGGWIAARSSGQQSLYYGRIERLFVGGKVETPVGELELPAHPASAAGPDLREIVLGSEGRMGIITEATIHISPLPEREAFHAAFFPDFDHGMTAVRQIAQAGVPVSMMRLSNAAETATSLALAGHERTIGAVERFLTWRGVESGKCLLIIGFTGRSRIVRAAIKEALGIAGVSGGVHLGTMFGNQWRKNRFRMPYLRNTLWEMGYAVDTVETATSWANVPSLMGAIENGLRDGLADAGEMVHVFTHLSHIYPHGSSIYTTLLFRLAETPDETFRRWETLKQRACEAIVAHNATISHQHGVGVDHMAYLAAEKGDLGIAALRTLYQMFDPDKIMNPGKLIPG